MAAGSIVVDLLMKTGSFVTDTARAEKSLKGFQKTTLDVTGTLKSLVPALSIGALTVWGKSVIEAGDALDKLSKRTGVAVKDLASLELIAKQSDTSLESLAAGFNKLGRSIGQAEAGNIELAKAFQQLGVTSKDPVEGFLQLADAVSKSNDATKTQALLAQVLGKGYVELLPLLKEGRGAIEAATKASAQYAEQQAKFAPQAAQFNDQLSALKQNLGVFGIALLQETGALKAFSDLAKFATENSANLANGIQLLTAALAGLATSKALTVLAGLSRTIAGIAGAVTALGVAIALDQRPTIDKSIQRVIELQNNIDKAKAKIANLENPNNTQFNRFLKTGVITGLKDSIERDTKEIAKQRKILEGLLKDLPPTISTPEIGGLPEISAATTKPDTSANPFAETAKNLAAFIQKVQDAIQPNKDLTVSLQEQLDSFTNLDPVMRQYLQNQVDIVKTNAEGARVIAELTERQKRLKELLAQTPAGAANQQVAQATKDVEILNQAYEAGEISLKEYLQAQDNLFGKTQENIKDTQNFMRDLGATFSSAFEQAILDGQKFRGVLAGLANDIQRLITRRFITDPLMKGFDSILGDIAGSIGLGTLFNAKGNAFDQSGVKMFASGGVVSGATPFTYGGGSLGVMGEAGPEAILPLSRINGDLGVKAQIGTPVVNVNIHEAAGTRASVEKRTDANGNLTLDVIVEQVESMMGRNIYRGAGLAPTLERKYGLNRAAGA
jgi:hypothetical protein